MPKPNQNQNQTDNQAQTPATPIQTNNEPAGIQPATQSIPPVDPNAIALQARREFLAQNGFTSEEEFQVFLQNSKKSTKKGDNTDHSETDARIQALEKEVQNRNVKLREMEVNNTLMTAISSLNLQLHDVEDFKEAARKYISTDKDDKVIVIDATGNVRLNRDGQRLTVAEFLQQLLEQKPYFIKNHVKAGAGIMPGNGMNSTVHNFQKSMDEVGKKKFTTVEEVDAARGIQKDKK